MKRILVMVTACILSLMMVACGNSGDDTASPTQTASQLPTEIVTAPQNDTPPSTSPEQGETPAATQGSEPPLQPTAALNLPGISSEVNEELVKQLTPEGATVMASEPGALVLESTLPEDELEEFYKAAVQELGAEQTEVVEVIGWQYVGKYGDGKDLVIAITSMGDSFTIAITY